MFGQFVHKPYRRKNCATVDSLLIYFPGVYRWWVLTVKKRSARLVFSTDDGRLCAECELPVGSCVCRRKVQSLVPADGFVRVRRETQGRGGKTVTVVLGLTGSPAKLAELARELKRACGAGGSIRPESIEVQGDHRELVAELLRARGYKVKLAGG